MIKRLQIADYRLQIFGAAAAAVFLFSLTPVWAAPQVGPECAPDACANKIGDELRNCIERCAKLSNFGLKPVVQVANKLPSQETSVPVLIGRILGGLLSLVGTIFFILMLYGGGLWMSARGEESQVEKAKNVILHSIIGLVATSFSYVIIRFIFDRFVQK